MFILLLCACLASSATLLGSIEGVPDLPEPTIGHVINGQSYQQRIDVSVNGTRVPVKQDYSFSIELAPGDYRVKIHSYDFILEEEHRISMDESDKKLKVPFQGHKQYYVVSQGSIGDMVMNSPFGFIFKNSLYTFLFTIMIGITLAPTLLQWFNPELAQSLKDGSYQEEIQRQVEEEEREKREKREGKREREEKKEKKEVRRRK